MEKIGKWFFLVLMLSPLWAKAMIAVQSSVDNNKIAIHDQLVFTIAVISTESVDITEPRVADIPGFSLVNKWEQSAVSQKMVSTDKGMDWQTQRKKEFHYQLVPKQTGNHSIDAVEVIVNGKTYRTQPIMIQIAQNAPVPKARPRSGQEDEEDAFAGNAWPGVKNFEDLDRMEEELFNQMLRGRGGALGQPRGAAPKNRQMAINPNEAFFVQAEVDKTTVYEGEQVTVNWYVYTRGNMESLDRVKFPTLRGFWKEIIEEVPTIQFEEEIVNGIPYRKALLASHALFPIKAGKAIIDEYKLKSRVRLPTAGGGFFGQAYEFTKSSKPTNIQVLPLPLEGRPKNYSGAVGQFEIHAKLEQNMVPMNQPFSLKIRFEGSGNAKLIELPAIEWPEGLEVYDTKTDSKFFKSGQSYKEFEVLLIPRKMGEMKIPSISVAMFDPKTKKYYQKQSPPLNIQVVAAKEEAGPGAKFSEEGKSGAAEKSSPRLPQIIPFSRASSVSLGSIFQKPILWLVGYLISFLGLGFFAYFKLGRRTKKTHLLQLVKRRMAKIQMASLAGDYRQVGAEMTNLYYLVLGESIGTGASVDMQKLMQKLPPSLKREKGDEIEKSFEIFQILSFAPEQVIGSLKDPQQMSINIQKAQSLIEEIALNAEGEA